MSVEEGLRVALEAALHAGNPGDVDFYADECAGVGAVLELGCGAGRVGAVLVEGGARVTGIDLDAAALEVAAARGIETVHGDIRGFRLGACYDRIIIPYSTLYCLIGAADVVRCLAAARAHLAPGGHLVLDCYCADVFHAEAGDAATGRGEFDAESVIASVDVDGRTWSVHERSRWWREQQRIDAWYRFVADDGVGPVHETCIRQRYLLGAQLPELLARAGLDLVGIDGGFDAEPWSPGSELTVVRARASDPLFARDGGG